MRASLSCVETSFFEALRLDIRRGESESGSRRDGEFTRSRGFNKISVQPSEIPVHGGITMGILLRRQASDP